MIDNYHRIYIFGSRDQILFSREHYAPMVAASWYEGIVGSHD